MNIAAVIESQYLAALAMLEMVVQRCPGDLWLDTQFRNPTWQISYHALFYTHLYVQPTEADFRLWEHARGEAHELGPIFWDGNRVPVLAEPYTQAEMLDYLDFVRAEVGRLVPSTDFASPESGFDWKPLNKLELQLHTIRHVQQHTGELCERLFFHGGVEVDWLSHRPGT